MQVPVLPVKMLNSCVKELSIAASPRAIRDYTVVFQLVRVVDSHDQTSCRNICEDLRRDIRTNDVRSLEVWRFEC